MLKIFRKLISVALSLALIVSGIVFMQAIAPQKVLAEDYKETGAVNLALTATASATSSVTDTNIGTACVNDGKMDTACSTEQNCSFPQYITLTWNTAQTFDTVSVVSFYALDQAPTNWDIEVSDDGTNWEKAASSGDVTWAYRNVLKESIPVKFDQVTKKAVRIKVNSANMTWGHFAVLELQVFDSKAPIPSSTATPAPTSAPAPTPTPVPKAPTTPKITLSANKTDISIKYDATDLKFYRPVLAADTFKPAKGSKYVYVAKNGKDTNKGTEKSPYLTVKKAVSVVKPGDVIYIKAGTYIEDLNINKSGTKEKPIIISAAPGQIGKIKITPSADYVKRNADKGAQASVITLNNAKYVQINGLVIEGPRGRPEAPAVKTFFGNGISFRKGSTGSSATNNIVYYCLSRGIETFPGADNISVRSNLVFENGTDGAGGGISIKGNNSTVDGNIVYKHPGCGISIYDEIANPTNNTVSRNLVLNSGDTGISALGTGTKVYNNTAAHNGWGIALFGKTCTNVVIKNNIISLNDLIGDGSMNAGWADGTGMLTDDYNVYYPQVKDKDPDPHIKPGAHDIYNNPMFNSEKIGDYRLKSSSPAIDAGVNIGLQFKGKAPDLGCYEK